MALLGGFEIQLLSSPAVTEAEIRESVRKSMDIFSPGGGYVPFYYANKENKNDKIVVDEILKYSSKFYGPRPA